MTAKSDIRIGSLSLKNPVLVASGTFGYGEEFAPYLDLGRLGGIITKTITFHPRAGNRPPRVYETPAGMLNAIGLQNEGLDDFLRSKLPVFEQIQTALVVSVGGETNAEYADVVRALTPQTRVDAFELNISCPNVTCRDKLISQDEQLTYQLVKDVRQATQKPLIVKLSPNVADITRIARAAEKGGADAVSLINTVLGMAVNIKTRRPVLGNLTGGLSGPAIRPIAVRMVWQVRQAVSIPVIGMGGIMTAQDALEFIIAGATAVCLGTANFVNPSASLEVIAGIEEYLKANRIVSVIDLVGSLKVT